MSRASEDPSAGLVFDQDAIRGFIGVIALLLPVLVGVAAWEIPESISGSYHEPGDFPFLPYFPQPRDIFVGSLFIIGAFLMSYKGRAHENVWGFWSWLARFIPAANGWGESWRRRQEDIVSSVGGISAWIVALFPTEKIEAEEACSVPIMGFELLPPAEQVFKSVSVVHLTFAAVLFLTTVYFCLVAFRVRLGGKIRRRGPAGVWYRDALKWRLILYHVSGAGILLVILFLGAFALVNYFRGEENTICLVYKQTYWAEVVMLFLFAAAWITASKPSFLKDPGEKAASPGYASE